MFHDADQNVPSNVLEGKRKNANDPRIMPRRKWLRRTGLDELPQIINILRGDMQLFGPRPHSLPVYDRLSPRQKQIREKIKPGIFGNYALNNRDKRNRTLIRLEDILIHLWSRKKGVNLVKFNLWLMMKSLTAVLRGENK